MNMTRDNLAYMLNEQGRLQTDVFGFDFATMTTQERVDYIKENVLALTDELHEMLAEMSWKPWAKSEFINDEKAVSEYVDAWHFMMNILIALAPEMGGHEMASLLTAGYEKKREINVQRQEDGYDGQSTKCPECKRALDDINAMVSAGDGVMACTFCLTDVTVIYDRMVATK
jgi:hypothetical protein